jgi:prevent-host-death family protein
MNASMIDLRRRPKRILEAVENRETVILSRRGKPIAQIAPLEDRPSGKVQDHPAFGLWEDRYEILVDAHVRNLRKGRFHDL